MGERPFHFQTWCSFPRGYLMNSLAPWWIVRWSIWNLFSGSGRLVVSAHKRPNAVGPDGPISVLPTYSPFPSVLRMKDPFLLYGCAPAAIALMTSARGGICVRISLQGGRLRWPPERGGGAAEPPGFRPILTHGTAEVKELGMEALRLGNSRHVGHAGSSCST